MEIYKVLTTLLVILLSVKIARSNLQAYRNEENLEMLQNFAQNAANKAEELKLQVNAKLARTSNTMLGNMDAIIAMAMAQLAAPLAQVSQQIATSNSDECRELWNISELRQRIDYELRNCMQDVDGLLTGLRADSDAIDNMLQSYLNSIANLPLICQTLNALPFSQIFASNFDCVNRRIADIDDSVNSALERANIMEMRTLQMLTMSAANAQQCTREVVSQVLEQLNDVVQNC